MMGKTIDILMAVYNGEMYISEQIDSIINQSYKNWRLLIRDDKSKDNTNKIITEYSKKDSRIKIIKDDKGNLGFVKNFEELLNNSDSEYIIFSDQDDVWFNDKVENLYNVIIKKNNEKAMLIYCNCSVCDSSLNIIKNKFVKPIKNKINSYFFNFVVQGSSTMINKKMKEIALPFFEEVYIHDRYLDLIAEFLGEKIFIDKSLMCYRQHANNLIGSKNEILKKILNKRYFNFKDRELIYKLYREYSKDIVKEKKIYIEKYLEITNIKISRIKRIYLIYKSRIYMNIKKQIFLLVKG